jgi:FdhD protein
MDSPSSDAAASDDPGLESVPCDSCRLPGGLTPSRDWLVVEEPIEFRIAGLPVATVMRTPGNDRELALGFLYGEGWIEGPGDVGALAICSTGDDPATGNVADLTPSRGSRVGVPTAPRSSTVSASCGVCGKRTIAEVLSTVPPLEGGSGNDGLLLDPGDLQRMGATLRGSQRLFERSGALHAAGIFEPDGRLIVAREDVGRRNAVDKAVGALLFEGRVPLAGKVLLVSGRASFEIVQKARRASIPVVAAVSGVSSLARDLAEAGGVTLIGFLRDSSFTVYAHPQRVRPAAP